MSKEEFYEQTKIVLTKEELAHFEFGSPDKISFLDQLRPMIRRYAKNGFRKPKDVSRLRRTATSVATNAKRGSMEARDATDERTAPASEVGEESYAETQRESSRAPLTRDEIAKRLAAIGRILPRG